MQLNLARKTACAGIALAVISSGCAMFEPKGHPNTAQPVGSTFVRDIKNSGSYGSVNTQATFTRKPQTVWQGQVVFPFEQSGQPTLLQTKDGSFLAIVKGDVPVITWEPAIGYDWPLTVGKTFTKKNKLTNHVSKQSSSLEWTAKVEAYEDVVTRAGTFKAFRVNTTDNLGNQNTQWFSAELGIFVKQQLRRTAQHSAGPGTQDTEIISQTITK